MEKKIQHGLDVLETFAAIYEVKHDAVTLVKENNARVCTSAYNK